MRVTKQWNQLWKVVALATVMAGLSSMATAAQADNYRVYSPLVTSGESQLGAVVHYDQDNDSSAVDGSGELRVSAGHAFTDSWNATLRLHYKRDNNTSELASAEWSNVLQLTQEGKFWADFGLLAELQLPVHGSKPAVLKAGPLIEKTAGAFTSTLNLFVTREFGSNARHDTGFGYAARVRWNVNPYASPAIEAYGSPGWVDNFAAPSDQRHQVGPALYGSAQLAGNSKLHYSAAILRGITQSGSPDWTFVGRLQYRFF